MTFAQSAAIDQAVAALRSELGQARATVAWSSDWFSGNAKSTALAALDACAVRIASLDTACRLRLELNDAAYPFSRWQSDAEETHATIASVSGDTSTWSLTGVLKGAAAASVADVKQVASVAAPVGLGLVVAALLVLAAVHLAPLWAPLLRGRA